MNPPLCAVCTCAATARPGSRVGVASPGGWVMRTCDGANTATPPTLPLAAPVATAGAQTPFQPRSLAEA
eukprot:1567008-Pyramimonas_sp.AAC.1